MSSLGGDPSEYSPEFERSKYYVLDVAAGKVVASCSYPNECDKWVEMYGYGGTYAVVQTEYNIKQHVRHQTHLEKF